MSTMAPGRASASRPPIGSAGASAPTACKAVGSITPPTCNSASRLIEDHRVGPKRLRETEIGCVRCKQRAHRYAGSGVCEEARARTF